MNEMIARVANAIRNEGETATTEDKARAAIAAMREPTQPMALGSVTDESPSWLANVKNWRVMIDLALAEDHQHD
jgi:hypothetical protein